MKTVTRLFRSSIHDPDFAVTVGTTTARAGRLKEFLMDETYSVYLLRNNQTWEGYLVATYRHGDPSLTCHYFEEFVPGAFDTVGLALVLDHTGFQYMSCPAPTPEVEATLVGRGFELSDIVWACHSKLFDGVINAPEIAFISGDRYDELSRDDKETIMRIVGAAVYEEMDYDVRGHYTYVAPLADTAVARIRHANVETVVWRASGVIVGIAQIRLVSPGTVELSGAAVEWKYRKRGIGRRLVAALFEFAQRYSDQVYIETAANNAAANHLYGEVMKCKQVLRTLTLKRNPELVSWKRSKNRVERAIKDEPTINVSLSGTRG